MAITHENNQIYKINPDAPCMRVCCSLSDVTKLPTGQYAFKIDQISLMYVTFNRPAPSEYFYMGKPISASNFNLYMQGVFANIMFELAFLLKHQRISE